MVAQGIEQADPGIQRQGVECAVDAQVDGQCAPLAVLRGGRVVPYRGRVSAWMHACLIVSQMNGFRDPLIFPIVRRLATARPSNEQTP